MWIPDFVRQSDVSALDELAFVHPQMQILKENGKFLAFRRQ
jgi:hypothetical protein